MDFKVSGNSFAVSAWNAIKEKYSVSLLDLVESKSSLIVKVIENLNGNQYVVDIFGKRVLLPSESKLFAGEILQLQVKKTGNQVQLEILQRSNTLESFKLEDVWSKNYYSPLKLINKTLDSNHTSISQQKIFQLLDVFFPGLEWKQDTNYFEWSFSEGEANGFWGRTKDSNGFYLNFTSKNLGEINSHFLWKKSDFSDFVLHCVFHKLSTYFYANENLHELKKMLSSNSILANNILFHYSSMTSSQGNWVA